MGRVSRILRVVEWFDRHNAAVDEGGAVRPLGRLEYGQDAETKESEGQYVIYICTCTMEARWKGDHSMTESAPLPCHTQDGFSQFP